MAATIKTHLCPDVTTRVAHATITLARRQAHEAVKAALRARGIKLTGMAASDICAMADEYLAQHRAELIAKARERVERWVAEGVFGKRAQREALNAVLPR
jgi:hypothetical protein